MSDDAQEFLQFHQAVAGTVISLPVTTIGRRCPNRLKDSAIAARFFGLCVLAFRGSGSITSTGTARRRRSSAIQERGVLSRKRLERAVFVPLPLFPVPCPLFPVPFFFGMDQSYFEGLLAAEDGQQDQTREL